MRKIGALAAAIVIGMMLAWMAGAHVVSVASPDRAWASDDFARRLPHHGENASATRILATVERLGDFHAVRPALRDVLRGKPASSAAIRFVDGNANTIRTLRAEIVSNPPPVWASDPEEILDRVEPPLLLHLQLYAILGADAEVQHTRGNDRAAAADAHAASILAHALARRPEIASVIVAVMSGQIDRSEIRPSLLRAIEYEAWIVRARAERDPAGEPDGSRFGDTIRQVVTPFVRPIRLLRAGYEIAKMRRMAAAVAATPADAPLPNPEMSEWAPLFERINHAGPASSATQSIRSPHPDRSPAPALPLRRTAETPDASPKG